MVFTRRTIESIWRRHSVWSQICGLALTPFSLLFSLGVRGRNLLYDFRCLPIARVSLNVVSIGNLTVGGTGKTPLTLWLAQNLQQRGYRVGILTRGYKGAATGPTLVGRDGTPLATPVDVGDEAVMLARRFPGIVIAGRDRVAAAVFAHTHFDLEVAILDDGFQHRRLHREVDVLLVSAQGSENNWLLPAGPFREPLTSMHRAHAIVLSKRTGIQDYTPVPLSARNTQHATCDTQRLAHRMQPAALVFYADLVPTALVSCRQDQWHELPLSLLANKRVMTVTGIANPAPFYHTLREHGADVARVVEFPDHHSYTHMDRQQLEAESQSFDLLVTTEKDLVKLERFPQTSDRLVALRVQTQLEPTEPFLAAVEQRLRGRKMHKTDDGRTISDQSNHGPAR